MTADFSQGCAFQRGEYVPIDQASIPMTDWGFLRSDATYDVVTVWDGAFFRLDAHLDRFFASCASFRLDPGRSRGEVTRIVTECVRRSGLKRSYVEMIVTRGQPPWGSRDPRQAINQFYAFAVPFVWIANEEQRLRGLHVIVSDVQRIPPASVDPTAKNYHWNDLTMGLLGALDAGADTVLLRDAQDNVVEGPGFNVFAVSGRKLVTPREGVLHGVTRRTAIEIARAAGYDGAGARIADGRTAGRRRGLHHQLGRRRDAGDARERQPDRRRRAGPRHPRAGRHLLGLARAAAVQHADRLLILHPVGGHAVSPRLRDPGRCRWFPRPAAAA